VENTLQQSCGRIFISSDSNIEQLSERLRAIHDRAIALEAKYEAELNEVHPASREGARNLVHYLALRKSDTSELRQDLRRLGLSSLDRAERNVLGSIDAIEQALSRLSGGDGADPEELAAALSRRNPTADEHRRAILGPTPEGRDVSIMVTLPTEAADNPSLVAEMLAAGMNVARINSAHDDAATWEKMIANVHQAATNDGVECRIGEAGEVEVRSVANMSGYYKQADLTAEVLTEDGWLKTGDVGEIDGRGRLRITGRIKEIFKTEKGKYVAPAPIENRLVSQPGVEQACVMGPGLSQPIALLSLSVEERDRLMGPDRERFQGELEELLKRVNGQLDAHERLRCLVVVPEEWSVENGMVTPTLKLKRNVLEDHYQQNIDKWASQKGVVWG